MDSIRLVEKCRGIEAPIPDPPAVARTYRGDRDGWERVLEHRNVVQYSRDHPEEKSGAVSTALELPRQRIRSWVDGDGAPDPVHGLRTAIDRGWILPPKHSRRRRALAQLVTWTFAGGSIATDTFAPRFAAHDLDEQRRLGRAAADIGVQLTWIDREADGHGVEAHPAKDQSVFGHVLVAAGAETDLTDVLPAWILDGQRDLRLAAAECYLECRAQIAGEGEVIQIREQDRPNERLEAIGELLVGVADVGSWTVGGDHVRLDVESTEAVRQTTDVEFE